MGKAITFSEKGTAESLPDLVSRLSDKLLKHALPADGWKSSSEATHYAQLGRWCIDNRLYEEGGQALETAVALGDTSRATAMLRVKAYAMQAYPDDLGVINTPYQKNALSPESLPARLQAVSRAAELAVEYSETNRSFSSGKWTLEDPFSLGMPVMHNCLRTLRAAYEYGLHKSRSAEVAEARHAVQKLVVILQDLVKAKHARTKGDFRDYQIRHASIWNETPEATMFFYREILKDMSYAGAIRGELFHSPLTPYLDGEGTPISVSPPELTNAPWIIGWQGQSDGELANMWRKFVQDYGASSDPVQRADALKFEYYSDHTVEGRAKTFSKIMALLKEHANEIAGPRGTAFVSGFRGSLNLAFGRQENATALEGLLDVYRTTLGQQVVLPSAWIFYLSDINGRDPIPADSLRGLLVSLDGYTQWYTTQPSQTDRHKDALARARQSIMRAQPEVESQAPAAGALAVTRLWLERREATATEPFYNHPINGRTVKVFENRIWFLTQSRPPKIVCLDPTNMKVVSVTEIPAEFDPKTKDPRPPPSALEVTEKWLVVAFRGQVLLCSRAGGEWRALDLPPSAYRPRWVGEELYLLYDVDRGDRLKSADETLPVGSGLIRVSLPDGKIENLVSSRRTPPQSALDGRPLGKPRELWKGETGLTIALAAEKPSFQVYATPFGKNDWRPVSSDSFYPWTKLTPGGVLLGLGMTQETFSHISLMDEHGIKVLLANPGKSGAAWSGAPEWDFPEEMKSMPAGKRCEFSPVMRQGDLCVYRSPLGGDGEETSLYYFEKGKKEGVKIPLSFDLSTLKDSVQAKIAAHPSLGFDELAATDYGLIIPGSSGLWIIPWADIDAYRTAARKGR